MLSVEIEGAWLTVLHSVQSLAKPPVVTLSAQNRFNGCDSKGRIWHIASERTRNSVTGVDFIWPYHTSEFSRLRSANPDPKEKWLQKNKYTGE